MLIGQLAERTGTSERLLRHYERVSLLTWLTRNVVYTLDTRYS